ncbi:uncharacterized protein LOC125377057 [Haliotis rufescens]|uniref:uncharacterized protein LOC125377057 n=1 Tax=Haliotis rufescens TaxID=6454 RepID=UPI00201F2A79|nr:uncharacterized protein LOC125377057 [Haliotis rufescens]
MPTKEEETGSTGKPKLKIQEVHVNQRGRYREQLSTKEEDTGSKCQLKRKIQEAQANQRGRYRKYMSTKEEDTGSKCQPKRKIQEAQANQRGRYRKYMSTKEEDTGSKCQPKRKIQEAQANQRGRYRKYMSTKEEDTGSTCQPKRKIQELKFALEFKKYDYVELVETEKTRIEQRNKLIKIADTSEGGWETVKNYVARDVASDSEDDKKITRAENKAVKKIKSNMGRSACSPYYRPRGGHAPSATVSSAEPAAVHSFSMFNQPFRRNSSSGACFSCGGFGHFRRQCPMSGEQQPAQTT